jgi:hypothetical protein
MRPGLTYCPTYSLYDNSETELAKEFIAFLAAAEPTRVKICSFSGVLVSN